MSNDGEGEGATGDTSAGGGRMRAACGVGGGGVTGDDRDGTGAEASSAGTGAADVRPRLA